MRCLPGRPVQTMGWQLRASPAPTTGFNHSPKPRIIIPQNLIAPRIVDKHNHFAAADPPRRDAFHLHLLVEPHGLERPDNTLGVAVPRTERERGSRVAG